MYAIIESGGKQMCVSLKERVKVEKLDVNPGDVVEFPVLLVSGDGETAVGSPQVAGATVKGKVIAQGKAKKVIVFHYKPKDNYRKKAGHRQPFTEVEIIEISAPGISGEKETAKETVPEESAADTTATAEAENTEE